MLGEVVFGVIFTVALVGAFCLLFTFGEWIFYFAYENFPRFSKWWDKFCESLPDWDESEEC